MILNDYFAQLLIGSDLFDFNKDCVDNIAETFKEIIAKRNRIHKREIMLCSIHKSDDCLALIYLKYEWLNLIKVYEIASTSTIKLTNTEKNILKQIFAKLGVRKCREVRRLYS